MENVKPEGCHSERSAEGAEARNRDRPGRGLSVGTTAIPRFARDDKSFARDDKSFGRDDGLRQDFPILATKVRGEMPLVYLDNAATTQKPQCVIDATSQYYAAENANIHRGVHWLSEQATEAYDRVREAARAFLGAEHAHEIIFTRGTTDGINLVASSFGDAFV